MEKAAEIQRSHLNEPDDAANTLTEAFKVYKKTDPEDAGTLARLLILCYSGTNRLSFSEGITASNSAPYD